MSDAGKDAKLGDVDSHRAQLERYEQFIPKQELAQAITAYAPVLDTRLTSLRWMAVACGAITILISSFTLSFVQLSETPIHIAAGLLFTLAVFAVCAIIFGFATLSVSTQKFNLHNYHFEVLIGPLINHPRLEAEQRVKEHLTQANRMDGIVGFAILLFAGGIVLSGFVLLLLILPN